MGKPSFAEGFPFSVDRETREMRGLSWKKAPNPQRTCWRVMGVVLCFTVKDYGSYDLSRDILPTAKLLWIFAEDSRVCKHPLFVLGQNPPEFPLCEAKFCPRQEGKAFNLKAKFADRANIFKVAVRLQVICLLKSFTSIVR